MTVVVALYIGSFCAVSRGRVRKISFIYLYIEVTVYTGTFTKVNEKVADFFRNRRFFCLICPL